MEKAIDYDITDTVRKQDDPDVRKHTRMITDAGKLLRPSPGTTHMGTIVVHLFGDDKHGTKKIYDFACHVLLSQDVSEQQADAAWKVMGNRIMEKFGRKPRLMKKQPQKKKDLFR